LTDPASAIEDHKDDKHEIDVWAQQIAHTTGCPCFYNILQQVQTAGDIGCTSPGISKHMMSNA